MTLSEYLRNQSREGLAAMLGVHLSMVSQWVTGRRPVAPKVCVEIERATDGAVTRMDLRPDDWWRIWPELAAAHPDRVPAEPAQPAEAR